MYTGGGSVGVEIERHVGGGDGYVMIEKAIESPNFILFYEGARKQTVRAPKSGRYTITAVGAKGGNCNGCDEATCKEKEETSETNIKCYRCERQFHDGGYGALARGTFLLSEGDEIDVVVAGRGGNCRILSKETVATLTATGGSGGGASSVRVRRQSDGQNEELLLAAAGGGGAGFYFQGEDGRTSQFGGWVWGGSNGGGGTIPDGASVHSGAGGGGVFGDGASRSVKVEGKNVKDEKERIWAQGGSSLLDGGLGGFVDRFMGYNGTDSTNKPYISVIVSGHPGGYGGGGQGGFGE